MSSTDATLADYMADGCASQDGPRTIARGLTKAGLSTLWKLRIMKM